MTSLVLLCFSYPVSKLSPYPEAESSVFVESDCLFPPTLLLSGPSHYLLDGSSLLLGLTAFTLALYNLFSTRQLSRNSSHVMSLFYDQYSPIISISLGKKIQDFIYKVLCDLTSGYLFWPRLELLFSSLCSTHIGLRMVPRVCSSTFPPQAGCLERSSLLASWFTPLLSQSFVSKTFLTILFKIKIPFLPHVATCLLLAFFPSIVTSTI